MIIILCSPGKLPLRQQTDDRYLLFCAFTKSMSSSITVICVARLHVTCSPDISRLSSRWCWSLRIKKLRKFSLINLLLHILWNPSTMQTSGSRKISAFSSPRFSISRPSSIFRPNPSLRICYKSSSRATAEVTTLHLRRDSRVSINSTPESQLTNRVVAPLIVEYDAVPKSENSVHSTANLVRAPGKILNDNFRHTTEPNPNIVLR